MNKPRIYGSWAGNPRGHPEDKARCIESVCGGGRGDMPHQCDRKRGHGEGGLYCKQHDPKAVKAARDARTAKYNAYWKAKELGWKVEEKRGEIVALARKLVTIRSLGKEFDALEKAVKELDSLEARVTEER